jgi:serine/threonine protein kinase/tetratricopeptide (TPR) repeat protein
MMDSTRWGQIQALFHEAADLPHPEQSAFLQSACGDDTALMTDVLALLEEDARGTSVLDSDVAHVAHHMLDEAALPALQSKEFGPYRIVRVLGEGGMGVVYLAERTDLGSQVAIKILRDAWLSPARRERFSSEQRMLAQLNHPSIARLYDAETLTDGTPWFVMEYVEGVPLTEYCAGHECPIEERLKLFCSVCEAVQYAHAHALIHRDLKPSNILVKSDGSIRLLDFGIAKQLESLDVPVDQTRTGLRLMTPAYAAPEQIRGDRVGIQTDVYSLGVILYELLAGRLPFDLLNKTPGEVETILAEQQPEKPSATARRTNKSPGASTNSLSASKTSWADLDVMCLTAMHKDPQRRYASVEALIRDVDHYLKREPLEARPDRLDYRVSKFVRRNRSAVSAAGLVFITIVGLVVFYTVRLTRARNAALAEAARTERVQRFMQNMFQGGDEEAGPADDLRVVTLLDRGAQQARSLDADPAVQAELFETLGDSYEQLGKYDQAEPLLNLALEKRRLLYGPDSAQAAESLVALGVLRKDQGKLEDAERLVSEGLAISKRHLPPKHPALAKAASTLGRVMVARGEYVQAIPILEEALLRQSAPGAVTADQLGTMGDLANCQFYLGHYAESDFLNRRGLELDRQLFGDRHPNVAEDYLNIAAIQFEWGHYAEVEKYDRQALDIIQSWYGKDHPETSAVLTILGRALVAEGKIDEASSVLDQALGIQERAYGKTHPQVASTVNELGKAALERGNLDEAEADFTRAAGIWKTAYNGKHYYIGTALANLGGVYMERKQYPRAESFFRDALEMYAKTLPEEHKLLGVTRIRLGGALVNEHRYEEAVVESLAGYQILMKQTNPPLNWMHSARKDLLAEYDALNQPAKAALMRAQIAISAAGPKDRRE